MNFFLNYEKWNFALGFKFFISKELILRSYIETLSFRVTVTCS